MSDKLSDDERARLDAEVNRDYEMSAKWPFDASDAWWNDDSRHVALPAVDSAHAAARAIIRDLSDRGGIKRGFENIDEETRVEIVTKLAAIIRAASPAPAIPAVNPVAVPRDLLASLVDDVEEYAGRHSFRDREQEARSREIARARAILVAPAISESEYAVAWQIRRISSNGAPLNQWEPCTKELYDATLATGRYAGYENGPRCEVRELVAARKGEKS
ncbi:hypothetical protein MMZ06_34740 [Burkholderia gladioli]|uniref:hypothetical protein n=1 Tax=Burkholderia gladioli TaxID=28095 RepID=UPI001F4B8C0F|nr:hypothetical protein [Burkholderia gladioli]MCH7274993.1 hypothetical protein [Burkholderia gladioli]